ncbi:MAG TPA: hypothetical protein VJ946_14805, partial [Bacteroidales bacterium]|nr:hypothetical protein [Bacteroidales bacterium]
INDLFINKMPGFRKGLKAYENLSPGINLIYGPNASGKSSTARMIKNIIWPENTIGYDADARLKTGDDQWHISIDASRILRERNGQPASFGGIPAADTRNRYMLSLHELIMADDKDMAEYILRESSGGYDLDAAADELEYKETIPPKSKNEYKAYNEAEENYKKALESQKALSKEEEKLEQLETQKQEAEKADRLKHLYEIRLDYLQKQKALNDARSRLENFPVAFEKLSGNEADRLESLRKETHDLEAGMREDEKTIRQTEDELTKLELPENGVDDKVLEELKIRQRELNDEENQSKQRMEKRETAAIRAEKALLAIDPDADVSRWNGISIESVNHLQQFLTNAYNRLYQVNKLKQDIAQIDKELSQKPDKEADDIRHAIKTLSDWMKSESKQAEAGQALKLTLMV